MWFFKAIGNVLIEAAFYCYLAFLLIVSLFKKADFPRWFALSGEYFCYICFRKQKLKKSICQNCHNKEASIRNDRHLRWRFSDTENWIQGTVCCPHVSGFAPIPTTSNAPENCPYALEHLVS